MGFKEYFEEEWNKLTKPYDSEDRLIKKFTRDRKIYDFPDQYGSTELKYETFNYDVESVCSFLIVNKSGGENKKLGQKTSIASDSWNYDIIEQLSMFPNPKRIALSEPTRQEITNLQYNSKIVERGGMPIKNLSISGNFGFFPSRDSVAPVGKLPKDGIGSGLFFSMLWSSFFRYYEQMVSYDSDSENISLVFIDHVKQEGWIVEPNSIDSEQNDGQKFQHPYSWSFTVLSPYYVNFWPVIDKNLWDKLVDLTEAFENDMQDFERFTGRLSRYVTDFVDSILNPLKNILSGVKSLLNGIDTIMSIPKQVCSQVAVLLTDLQNTLDGIKDENLAPLELDTAIAVQDVKKSLKKIINVQEIFLPESDYSSNNASVLYNAPKINKQTGEVLERGQNAPIMETETIKNGDTIQTLSKRIFGTYKGWEEIVKINGLRPPYISSQEDIDTNGLKGVIAYGDTISYTKNGKFSKKKENSSISNPLPIINDTTRTKKLTPFERALGTDIAIIDGDIQFTKDNDFKTVSGLDNIKQQISHKFSLEKGKLRSSEYIGITKARGRDGAMSEFIIKQDISSMVNADKRFSGVSVDTSRDGDIVNATAKIYVKNLKEPLPVKVKKG